MDAIKEYKPISLVFYIDGSWERCALPLDESKRDAFIKAIEKSKMVELEWITINTFDIKEIRPAKSVTELEKFFYSQSWNDRNYLTWRTAKIAWDKFSKIKVPELRSPMGDQKAIERLSSMLRFHHESLSKQESNHENY